MLGLTVMNERTDLPVAPEPAATPFAIVVKKAEQPASPEPFTLSTPPIAWEELDRRHKVAAGD
jgi:hypothetical protein